MTKIITGKELQEQIVNVYPDAVVSCGIVVVQLSTSLLGCGKSLYTKSVLCLPHCTCSSVSKLQVVTQRTRHIQYWVSNIGYPIFGYPILDIQYSISNLGYPIFGYQILDIQHWVSILDIQYWISSIVDPILDIQY